jgi:hypothetical protein
MNCDLLHAKEHIPRRHISQREGQKLSAQLRVQAADVYFDLVNGQDNVI